MTHTSGLGYYFVNADITRWELVTGNPNILSGLNQIFKAPMIADPGTKFEYGINIDWLGLVVEAASGQSLDKYLAQNILEPLGMDNTTWIMTAGHRPTASPSTSEERTAPG
jgi:methyl acetate hydrolase